VALFHVHHVQVTIHFQQVALFHVHHKDHKVLQQDSHVLEWLVHVQVQYVQVLQHVLAHRAPEHQVVLVVLVVLRRALERQVIHHINQILQEPVHQQLVDRNVQVVDVHHNAVVQVEHLEKMQVKSLVVNKNLVKHYAMSSTICRRHNSVAQLSLTVMERLLSVCDAVHRWLTLQTKSVQIQPH
jgi:hypothetical protein